MKRLIALTFTLITLTSCSFISDSEVENNNKTAPSISTSSTGTTRKIKNIKKPRINSGMTNSGTSTNTTTQISNTNNATSPTSQDETTPTGSSIEELSKINISEASIDTDSGTTETGGIEDVSEEQVSQLVDILLEAGK